MKAGFFLWSDYGNTLFLARRLKREGHPVLLYTHKPEAAHVGVGIVPRTTDPVPPKGFPFVLFDSINHGTVGRELRRKGLRVLGGNPFDRTLEADRAAGAQIMREIGIRTPETKEFRSVPLAVKFLEGHEGHWFVKAIGGDTSEASTYDAPADALIRYLRWPGHKLTHFQLSQRIEGTEVSCNGWFDGQRFVTPFDITLEEKKFMPGGLGPRTGCESNVVWLAQDERLADLTVKPLAGRLAREGYVGPVDLNSLIVADGKPTGLEWTARLGFDATQAWAALITPLGEQLVEFLSGGIDTWTHTKDYSVTVRVSMPPYPQGSPKEAAEWRGVPLDPRWLAHDHAYPDDVMAGDGPVAAGRDGMIGVIGATSPQWKNARTAAIGLAETLHVPNKQFNNDPLFTAHERMGKLNTHALLGHA